MVRAVMVACLLMMAALGLNGVAMAQDEPSPGESSDQGVGASPDADAHPEAFRTWAAQHAQPAAGASASPASAWQAMSAAELLTPSRSWPYVEVHGMFRLRAARQWHWSLGTEGTSPHLAPIDALLAPGRSEGTIPSFTPDGDATDFNSAWNNGRTGITQTDVGLQLEPHIHLTETFKVVLELGLAESFRLGDGAQPLTSFEAGPTDRQGLQLQLTQAYAEVNSFLGTFTAGRFRRHWGLGLVHHGGSRWSELQEARRGGRDASHGGQQCWDCDFATITDGLQWQVRAGASGPRITAGYTYHASGARSPDVGAPMPVAGALGNADERWGWYLQATNRASNAREAGRANRLYAEDSGSLFEWGAHIGWQRQALAYMPELGIDGAWRPSDLVVWTPDLWLRWQAATGANQRFRLELETAAHLGSQGFSNPLQSNESELQDRNSQDIQQLGAALEIEFQSAALSVGINAGFASGRDMSDDSDPGFGIRDRAIGGLEDNAQTAFSFHPSYLVDRILFREMIGSVTNAIYVGPWFGYEFWSRSEDVMGIRLDLLAATAAVAEATPSGKGFYGVEPGFTLFYGEPRYRLEFLSSVFIPGAAFAARSGRPRNPVWLDATDQSPVFASNRAARAAGLVELRLLWAF